MHTLREFGTDRAGSSPVLSPAREPASGGTGNCRLKTLLRLWMQDAIVTVLMTLALLGSVSPLVAADQTGGARPTPSPANRAQGSVDAARDRGTNPPTARLIKSIEFEGNRKFKDHVLRDRLLFQ